MCIITEVMSSTREKPRLGEKTRKTLAFLKRQGLVSPRELEKQGISREMLRHLRRSTFSIPAGDDTTDAPPVDASA